MNRYNDNALRLSAKFDNAVSLPLKDQINLYVEMMSYDFLKPFADEPLDRIKQDLVIMKDYHNLKRIKDLLYKKGIDFNYNKPKRTFYNDKHNVHSLSQSTIQVAQRIIASYPSSAFYIPTELIKFEKFFDVIMNAESYNSTIEPKSLFMAVWLCITNSEYKDDLLKRLKEELNEAKGHCLTGCIVRLVNSLRGFDFPQFETELDDYEYERSKTFAFLTKHLTEYDITSSEGIVREIERIVNDGKTIVMSLAYGKRILDAYTGTTSWRVINGKYFYR